ncbi:MAG TPA: alpha/beta fold hydrolase [Phaeodactylibacter sp.]|nr:alpha/beta fold hydrolase [Phaeodactylibacter sp.]
MEKIFIGLLLLYFFIIIGTYALQKYILFHPRKLNKDFKFSFRNPHEEFFLKTNQEENAINALLFKADSPAKGLVLYFHGNADNLKRWGRYHEDFTSRGYDVFMIDYRGFGKSEGALDEAGFYKDAQLAYDWILEKYNPDEIIVYGRSLGCGVATHLATKVNPRMIILETPFYDVKNLFQIRASIFFLPFDFKYNFPNHKNLQKIKEPIYIFVGTKDRVVPNQSTEKLKPFLKNGDKYIEIKGANHKNLSAFNQYHQVLDSILK